MKTIGSGNRTSKVPWHLVNWNLQDIEISERFECSRERVRQKRKELGVGKPANWHRRRGSSRERIEAIGGTANLTLKDIAEKARCSRSYALQVLKGLKKGYKREDMSGRTKYDWGSADWSKPPKEIAAALGIENPGVVTQYRQRHGIKSSRVTASDKIRKVLKKGEVLTPEMAVKIGGCTLRYAKEVLKKEAEKAERAKVAEGVEQVEESTGTSEVVQEAVVV